MISDTRALKRAATKSSATPIPSHGLGPDLGNAADQIPLVVAIISCLGAFEDKLARDITRDIASGELIRVGLLTAGDHDARIPQEHAEFHKKAASLDLLVGVEIVTRHNAR